MGERLENLTNNLNLGLTMSLWLADDDYDHDAAAGRGPVISATRILLPPRMFILGTRMPPEDSKTDISDIVAARIGQSVHSAIERSFSSPARKQILSQLGYAESIADRLLINPTAAQLSENPDGIPIYLEQRAFREVTTSRGTKVTVSGKFDQVINGKVEDNKITKVYKFMKMDQTETSNYAMQQSIYRWLSPDKITEDMGQINFVLTDWKAGEAGRIEGYPSKQVKEMPLNLMSIQDTEKFIISRLDQIEEYGNADEMDLPWCPEEELWKDPDVFKYYANPEVAKNNGRATKNFSSAAEASRYKTEKGKGVVLTVPGEVRRCNYCHAAPLCTQRLQYT